MDVGIQNETEKLFRQEEYHTEYEYEPSERFTDISWNFDDLSANPSITWDIVQANPNLPWSFEGLSQNPIITGDIVQANLDKP